VNRADERWWARKPADLTERRSALRLLLPVATNAVAFCRSYRHNNQ